jgi:hypothetical protein
MESDCNHGWSATINSGCTSGDSIANVDCGDVGRIYCGRSTDIHSATFCRWWSYMGHRDDNIGDNLYGQWAHVRNCLLVSHHCGVCRFEVLRIARYGNEDVDARCGVSGSDI